MTPTLRCIRWTCGGVNTDYVPDAIFRTQTAELNSKDPNAFAEDPVELRMEAMRSFAASTGGLAFYNNNEVQNGIRSAIQDSSAYYMLGYYRSETPKTVRWRALSVKVRGSGACRREAATDFTRV